MATVDAGLTRGEPFHRSRKHGELSVHPLECGKSIRIAIGLHLDHLAVHGILLTG